MFENANAYVPPGIIGRDAANGQPDGAGVESDAASDQPEGVGDETEDRRPRHEIEIEKNQAAKTQEIAGRMTTLGYKFKIQYELAGLDNLVMKKEITGDQRKQLQDLGDKLINELDALDRQKAAADKLLNQIEFEPPYITNVKAIEAKMAEALSAGQINEEGQDKIKAKLEKLRQHREEVEAARKAREEQWRPVKPSVEAVAAPPVAPVEVPAAPVDVPTEKPSIISRFTSLFRS